MDSRLDGEERSQTTRDRRKPRKIIRESIKILILPIWIETWSWKLAPLSVIRIGCWLLAGFGLQSPFITFGRAMDQRTSH